MGKVAVALFAGISLDLFRRAIQTSSILYGTGAGFSGSSGKTGWFSPDRAAGTQNFRRGLPGCFNLFVLKKNIHPTDEIYFTGF